MSHTLADKLLVLVGPARVLHYGCRSATLLGALLQRGCDAWGWIIDPLLPAPQRNGRITRVGDPATPSSFDIVVVDCSVGARTADLQKLLVTLRSQTERSLVLDFAVDELAAPMTNEWNGANQLQIEEAALAAGYRRHPAAFSVARYERLNDPAPEALLCFEKVPDAVLQRWPLEHLLATRDLHMDMLREASPRSDAHLVRYALAAEWIRPGDTVLDCACGLGYGTALLAAASRGRRFIGVDIDTDAVAYARDNFANYPAEYHTASAIQLDFLPDRSVDMVVSFETIEHLPDYERFFDEVVRVLKPDGRMIGSVPHLWIDETGHDPNPHHYHAFDYVRIRDAFSRKLTVEARYGQTAPGGVKLIDAPRRIEQRPLQTSASEADTEWWILVAAADPKLCAQTAYSHPEFDRCTIGMQTTLTNFAQHYTNPWIYRQLIQNGQRIRDPGVLTHAIDTSMASVDEASADFGGLLAVRAYQALQDHGNGGQAALFESIQTYLEIRSDNPHVHRWQVSLSYVAALLALDSGERDRGKTFLRTVVAVDPHRFSPLLTTKTVAAHFLLGTISLVDGNPKSACASFEAGVNAARRALHAPDENAIGRPDHPLAFGFFELAEIADMAGQCALAIQGIDQFRYAPGQFWRCVDAKRFGLFSWNRNLETEQARMQTEIDKLRSECTLRELLPKRLKEVFLSILPGLARQTWARFITVARLSRRPGRHL